VLTRTNREPGGEVPSNHCHRDKDYGNWDKNEPVFKIPVFTWRENSIHAFCLLHFRKIGGDEAQTLNALVPERAPDDENLRTMRRERTCEGAPKTVRPDSRAAPIRRRTKEIG
jgi:hypothetical protein